MKRKTKFLIGATSILLASSLTIPFITSCTSSNSTITQQPDNISFVDNTDNYSHKINNPKATVFNPNQEIAGWQDFSVLSSNPNDAMYEQYFNNIDLSIIENDVYNFVHLLGKNSNINKNFLANISKVNVDKVDDIYNIEISFNIFNKSSYKNIYKLDKQNIEISPNQQINIDIKINSKFNKSFFSQGSTANLKLYFNYYFNNVTININGKEYNINEFSFHNYSLSLNKYFILNTLEVGYNDIQNFAKEKLSELTIEQLKEEISNTYFTYIDGITIMIDPLQTVLQNLIKSYEQNINTIDYLKQNAESIGIISNHLLQLITKDKSKDIKTIITLLLQDKKISEIIINDSVKKLILEIVQELSPDIYSIINQILNNINETNVDTQLTEIIELIKQFLPSIVPNIDETKLNQLFDDLVSNGLLSALVKNKTFIVEIIDSLLNTNDNQIMILIKSLINAINFEQNPIELLISLINASDDNSLIYLKELLKALIPNQTILDFINQLLFDNPNFNAINLVSFIDVFANPRDSVNGQVVKWSDWINQIDKKLTFSIYDGKLTTNFHIEFKSNIYLNIAKLYQILPNTIQIGTNSIPVNLMIGFMPKWISFNNGDYISIDNEFSDIEYDVINQDGDYKLSWQSFSKNVIDINLPNSLKTIYETSSTISSSLVKILNNIFYHKYHTNSYFKPHESILNENIITNYNPNKKNNQAIIMKNIDEQQLNNIKQEIDNSITESKLDDSEFVIYKGNIIFPKVSIYKYEISSSIDSKYLLNKFFNMDYYKDSFHIAFDINRIIRNSSILSLVEIPNVDLKSFSIYAPYNVYTNQYVFSNYYSINL